MFLLQARQDSNGEDGGSSPKFYKRDLVMILKERNELKEKINGLEEELASAKKRLLICLTALKCTLEKIKDNLSTKDTFHISKSVLAHGLIVYTFSTSDSFLL